MDHPRATLRWFHYITLPLWAFWWGFQEVQQDILSELKWRHVAGLMVVSALASHLLTKGF